MSDDDTDRFYKDYEDQNRKGSGEEDVEPVDNEYYSFLNVPRTASEAEINAAYKKLSRLYHPDKHVDEAKKKKAELMFAKLKLVHEVLTDPQRRAIYDCLGKNGLKEQGWQIVQRTKSPKEIREEYERLARERAEKLMNRETNPTSKFEMKVNATDLFERYLNDNGDDDDVLAGDLPTLEITEINFKQTVNWPITNAETVVLNGNVATKSGNGNGAVGCTWKTILSEKSTREIDISIGSDAHAGAKYFRRFSDRVFMNMSGILQFASKGIGPLFDISFGHQFDKHTVGYLEYSSNWTVLETDDVLAIAEEGSNMSTMIIHNTPRYHLMGSIQFGIPFTYIMLSATKKFEENQKKLRGVVKLGTFGAILEYGVETEVTKQSMIGATMIVGIPVGITLRIKVTRAKQTYTFPIQLTDEIMMQPLFYGTVVPILTWYTFKKLIMDPFKLRKKEQENQNQMRDVKEKILESKREAQALIDLMSEKYSRILGNEEAKNGLIIVIALYGTFTDLSRISEHLDGLVDARNSVRNEILKKFLFQNPEVIDVTIPLQCLVEEDSRIYTFEGTKSDLAGFYDPCLSDGDEKKLLVRYLYQNRLHQTILDDEEAVRLPKTNHKCCSVSKALKQNRSQNRL